jgi:hypothetical protein
MFANSDSDAKAICLPAHPIFRNSRRNARIVGSARASPPAEATARRHSGVDRLGKRTIRTIFAEIFQIPMATGSVCKLEAKVSTGLKTVCEEAWEYTRSKDANVYETGWKQGKDMAWLWVAVTQLVTVFLICATRNRVSFNDLVRPTPGILTTDRFPDYTHLDGDKRQVCWSHLRRDFQAMIDRDNAGSPAGVLPQYHSKYNPIERCWSALEQKGGVALLNCLKVILQEALRMTWKGRAPMVKRLSGEYREGIRLTKKEMKPYEARLFRSETLGKYEITIKPSGR